MAEVDTSIYQRPQQPNALDTFGNAVKAAEGLNVLRLFPGIQQKQQLDIQASQIANQTAGLNLAKQHLIVANGVIGSLLSQPNVSRKDITSAITDLVAFGGDKDHPLGGSVLTPEQAAKTIGEIPDVDDSTSPGQAALRGWLTKHYAQNAAMAGQIDQVLPHVQFVNTGGTTQAVDVNPLTNPRAASQTLPNTLSPTEQVAQVPGPINPVTNQPTVQTQANYARESGLGNLLPGGSAAPANALAPPAASPVSRAPAPAVPSAAAIGRGGVMSTQPNPVVTANNAADIQNFKTDQAGVATRETAVQSLQKALHALQLTNVGKSTATTHEMYSLLNAQGLVPQGLTDDVKNYDIFKKYTTDYARQQAGAGGTNLQLETAQASNPGTGISTQANLDVLKTNIGRERQAIAKVLDAPDQTGLGYGKHTAAFANNTDPRAFAWDMYTPAERQKIVKSLSKAQLAKLDHSLEIAAKYKLINVPGS